MQSKTKKKKKKKKKSDPPEIEMLDSAGDRLSYTSQELTELCWEIAEEGGWSYTYSEALHSILGAYRLLRGNGNVREVVLRFPE